MSASSLVTVLTLPSVLLLSYKILPTPTRFILQTFVLLPIFFATSLICTFIGALIKFALRYIISAPLRIYILQELFKSFGEVEWFLFEFWTNLRYVLSTEDDLSGVHNLNTILLGNHSASLYDFIPLGSISDYFNKASKSFVFVKKAVLFFPIMGWVESVCPHAIVLHRNWEKDKKLIADLCDKFNDAVNGDYKLVTPWMWFIFPEGTRFTKKKLRAAQEFAVSRGYSSHSNLLQPRVKGFSLLTHNLYKSLGAIIDATILYKDEPATSKNVFLNTRFCKYIHVHLRIFKKEDIVYNGDMNELNQWLRDRWTEKDEILQNMKNNKIEYEILYRSPWRAIATYLFYAIFNVYIIAKVFSLDNILSVQILFCCVVPVVITLFERSQKLDL